VPTQFELVVNEDRALYWLTMGAEPSDTVRSLLRRTGVWARYKGVEPAPPALSAEDAEEAAPVVVDDAPEEADVSDADDEE